MSRVVDENEVARVADVSVGSLYEYFPNKQALIDVVLERHLVAAEQGLAALRREAPRIRDAKTLCTLLVTGFVALHADDPKLHRALSSEVPLSPRIRRRVNSLQRELTREVEGMLRLAKDVCVADPAVAARLVVETTDALTHRWYVDEQGKVLPRERLVAELRALLEGYLLAAPATRQGASARSAGLRSHTPSQSNAAM